MQHCNLNRMYHNVYNKNDLLCTFTERRSKLGHLTLCMLTPGGLYATLLPAILSRSDIGLKHKQAISCLHICSTVQAIIPAVTVYSIHIVA